jgi:DNA-binding MarR family transcriptional regulator
MKKQWLDDWLPSKKFIKFLSVNRDCPLTFSQRLVYSFLVYGARLNKALSLRGITKATQLDRNTVRVVVRQLVEIGLAQRHHGTVQAVEPTGYVAAWFVSPPRLAEANTWADRLAYFRFYLSMPVQERSTSRRLALTPKQAAVYCLLLNLSKELPAGSEESTLGMRVCTASQALLAALLGIDRQTVRKALVKLEELYLVEVHQEMLALLHPGKCQLAWFQTRQPKKQKPPAPNLVRPWLSMSPMDIELAVADPNVSEDVRLFRRIRLTGRYTVMEVKIILEKADNAFGCLDVDRLRAFFKEAESEHRASQANGRFLSVNSFHLLSFKLDQAAELKRLRGVC